MSANERAVAEQPVTSTASLEELSVQVGQRIASIGVIGILGIAFLTIVDVLLRGTIGVSIIGLNEITALLLAVAVSACLPAGVARRISLTIDLVGDTLPESISRWFKAFGSAVLLLFFLLLAWRMGNFARELSATHQVTTILGWPSAPFIWTVAVFLAACVPIQLVVMSNDCIAAMKLTPALGWPIVACLTIAIFMAVLGLAGGLSAFHAEIAAAAGGSTTAIAIKFFCLMWIAVLLLVPIGPAMGIPGFLGLAAMLGLQPALSVVGSESKRFLTSEDLAVLPLFLLMGAFASKAGLSSDIYRFAQSLLGRFRGGLCHATIVACAGFGALTGSSLATTATIGSVALPEMRRRGYQPFLATGSVAAGGTLGQLLPPSSAIVVYALMTEESIGRLFAGALLPALLTVLLYLITILVLTRVYPESAPPGQPSSLHEIGAAAVKCWGAMLLMGLVLGGIYTGFLTLTESASVGAVGAFLFALLRRKLSGGVIWGVMAETTATIALIYTLIFGAVIFSFFMGATQLPKLLIEAVSHWQLAPFVVIAILVLTYLVLGIVMDAFAMMVITVPIFAPLVVDLGYSPIWWGILTIVCMEAGQISPPFGINLFVMTGIAPDVPVRTVYRGVWPFFGADVVKIIILMFFPPLVTWLSG
ncbi:TRAP transporter large permease subunit [Bradyrhizobium sp. AUGA SZCCT0042]|uniref:TRAP transporter large permease n=1 Tax=Bradyrhizobium sp. AUGA SZCCT0042 TaxID=2807651 RepID=UPI001BAAFF2A|nr:TRAP transporter large permease subunit [Bradyrhizobium sp. AUGA SZCCT0042]MBR1297364.1 TRAP transporter large permease subunit [Bradyrhizobium sp. AUGA SZCCT0042]